MKRPFLLPLRRAAALLLVAGATACAPRSPGGGPAHSQQATVGALRLIGEVVVPNGLPVQGTVFGGISGLDRGPDGTWYLLSDDKGEFSPARFYTARLRYDAQGFYGVDVTGVHFMQPAPGEPARPAPYVDPEAIRYDPATAGLYWTSEGDPALGRDPFVREMDTTGTFRRTLPALPLFHFDKAPGRGPRANATYEGLARPPDGRSLWLLMESPVRQDRPDDAPAAAPYPNRLSQLDARTGALLHQYVYALDPVTTPGHVNRTSEILALNDHEFLTLECSYFAGEVRVRVYAIDARGATDVQGRDALFGAAYVPVRKRLVADLTRLGHRLDNLEGLAFGPPLPNGHRTLVIVADNNFSAREINQFLAFEVLP
ncbi:esterase-like activity of phytase family protein [Hymenobacter caeli]|uniref:Phytase-like domain-containing protein n=1 Tax=Hymenobacter caeli TaxID=2735894 RepID=A0ABX2FSU6_9BACT|nr:esterase-like activity of phytase family protein [Hymenobacter caeli]NRT20263.1 hypothetical protein [Hymenobacter caeli]